MNGVEWSGKGLYYQSTRSTAYAPLPDKKKYAPLLSNITFMGMLSQGLIGQIQIIQNIEDCMSWESVMLWDNYASTCISQCVVYFHFTNHKIILQVVVIVFELTFVINKNTRSYISLITTQYEWEREASHTDHRWAVCHPPEVWQGHNCSFSQSCYLWRWPQLPKIACSKIIVFKMSIHIIFDTCCCIFKTPETHNGTE